MKRTCCVLAEADQKTVGSLADVMIYQQHDRLSRGSKDWVCPPPGGQFALRPGRTACIHRQ